MRVLIVVTHLLGTGHLSRALVLAKAFRANGHYAHIASGGVPVPNLSAEGVILLQLPPVKSDGINFTTLLTDDGKPADQAFLDRRKAKLLSTLKDVSPDVLITELYPFGRRVLKGEFLALLNAARDMQRQPKVFASIRDILAPPSKPQKVLETEAVLAAYYTGVLVHSDPSTTPLETSWPVTDALKDRLLYTGYVAPPPPDDHPENTGRNEVLVTAGGGDVGMKLFAAAVRAAHQSADLQWRILVGGSDKESNIARLKTLAQSDNIIIESTRSDFRQMMTGAHAIVCMCGYNTAMDVLQIGVPAVFIPFAEGGETEQTLRAQSLSSKPGFSMVDMSELSAEKLVSAVTLVSKKRPTASDPKQFQGANQAVSIVETHYAAEFHG